MWLFVAFIAIVVILAIVRFILGVMAGLVILRQRDVDIVSTALRIQIEDAYDRLIFKVYFNNRMAFLRSSDWEFLRLCASEITYILETHQLAMPTNALIELLQAILSLIDACDCLIEERLYEMAIQNSCPTDKIYNPLEAFRAGKKLDRRDLALAKFYYWQGQYNKSLKTFIMCRARLKAIANDFEQWISHDKPGIIKISI